MKINDIKIQEYIFKMFLSILGVIVLYFILNTLGLLTLWMVDMFYIVTKFAIYFAIGFMIFRSLGLSISKRKN